MDGSQDLAAAPGPPKALPLVYQQPAAASDSQRDASTTALSGGGAAGVAGGPSALDADAAAALQNVIKSMDGISPEAQQHLLQVVGGLATAAAPGEADSADRNSSPVASATTGVPAQRPALPGASGDAGSGCFLAGAAAPAAAPAPAGGESELPDTAFAAFVSQDRPLTPPGILTPVGGGLGLAGAPSLVTYKTKALAAAAGLVRCGPVGRSLRLAGAMCRSSSGSLADTLLSEAARAQSGLLTAALPRCDSLPELMAGATTCDLTDLPSLDFGFSVGLGTMELPSLTMLFDQQQAPAAPAAAPQQQQQGQAAAAAAAALAAEEEDAAPAWAAGPRVLGRPASFSAHSVTALFASSQPPLRPHMALAGGEIADGSASPHPALRPPQLLAPPSEMIVLSDATPNPAAAAAPAAGLGGAQHVSAFAGHALPAAPLPPAGGWGGQPAPAAFEPAGAQPYYGQRAALPMIMERQDTFDVLLRQVDAELTAEAELRQYAALEFDTMELDAKLPAAASAGPCATSFTSLGGMPAPSGGSAGGLAAPGWQQPKRRSVFEVSTLVPGGGLMGDPASCYGWPASSGGGSLSGSGAPALSGPSPFSMSTGGAAVPLPRAEPSVTAPAGYGLAGAAAAPRAATRRAARGGRGAGAAARGGAAGGGGAATGNGVEVARYSRVITCKTYLKRLNITQPMAEHLLPYHDLNVSSSGAATTGGGGDSPNSRKAGSYEALFKEEISLADGSGASFRVTYEGVSCNAQKHLRLTSGWRDFIRAHDVAVGDSIVFERRGDERRVLHVTIVKGAGADALARDDEDEGVPPTKKRRVARSKAVQRLA